MSDRRNAALATAALLATLLPAGDASACACCALPGQRVEFTEPLTGYPLEEIGRLRFAEAATMRLWTPEIEAAAAAVTTEVEGQDAPVDLETYTLAVTPGDASLRFMLTGADPVEVVLTLPAEIDTMMLDPKPGDGGAYETTLYKEWVLASVLRITPAGGAPREIGGRLIFHGTGRACTDASEFTHWTLEARDPNLEMIAFGKLAAAQ